MAGFIKLSVEKFETQQINSKINAEIFEEFQKRCKQQNIPMNVVFEAFCRQYANGKYHLNEVDIMQWKNYNGKTSTLNTTVNKEVWEDLDNDGVCETTVFYATVAQLDGTVDINADITGAYKVELLMSCGNDLTDPHGDVGMFTGMYITK